MNSIERTTKRLSGTVKEIGESMIVYKGEDVLSQFSLEDDEKGNV